MKTSEILENNILIAKFMGWQVIKEGKYFTTYKPSAKNPCSIKSVVGYVYERPAWYSIANHCNYHSDWNWLMPVVDKIESLGFVVEISLHQTCLYKKPSCDNFSCNRITDDKLKSTYMVVVEFIKWYNSEK